MNLEKLLKFFASLKLAVIIIILLSVLVAIGTIIESRYDATAAGKLVYKTYWMFSVLGLLVINLIAVMVDRWPWQKRHAPFILAHIGIITLLFGSYVTMVWGLDGSMRVGIREGNRFVQVPQTDLTIYSSFDGSNYVKLLEKEVDFYKKPPSLDTTLLKVDEGEIKVIHYEPYMNASKKVVGSDSVQFGSAIRFQLSNARVNMNDWLVQRKPQETVAKSLGLAQFILTSQIPMQVLEKKNQLYIQPKGDLGVEYLITYRDENLKSKKGFLKEGEVLQTGWMGLEFKLIRFFPHAEEKWEFEKVDRPSPLTTAAIQVSFQGKEYWVQQEDVLKLFTTKSVYIISYGSRKVDLGFQIFLKEFTVGRYPGSSMASSYESKVHVESENQEYTISMNEPLKHNGLTIYQASFQENEQGPIASIFSVNYDPGRWIKYLGSLLMTLGTILLFYNKRKASRAFAPKTQQEVNL